MWTGFKSVQNLLCAPTAQTAGFNRYFSPAFQKIIKTVCYGSAKRSIVKDIPNAILFKENTIME